MVPALTLGVPKAPTSNGTRPGGASQRAFSESPGGGAVFPLADAWGSVGAVKIGDSSDASSRIVVAESRSAYAL